jgi:hypothetical protein
MILQLQRLELLFPKKKHHLQALRRENNFMIFKNLKSLNREKWTVL